MGDSNGQKSCSSLLLQFPRAERDGGRRNRNQCSADKINKHSPARKSRERCSEITLGSPASALASERCGNGGDAGSDLFKSNQAKATLSDVNSLIGRLSGRNERIEHYENPILDAWNVILASYSRTETTNGAFILGVESASPIERHLHVP